MTAGRRRRLARLSAATAAGIALAAALPTTAWAHVGLSASSTAAGSASLLTFAFSHGCDESPTTRIAIQIPDGIDAVAPTVNPGWTVDKVMADLDTPATDSHGNTVTQRVAQVVYTAKEPVPTGLRDAFVLSLTLPADATGTTLAFPTVQTCEVGENAWIEVPAAGQDAHDLAFPAPALTVTGATGSGGDAPGPDGTLTGLVVVSLVVGALGLVTGGLALVRGRKPA